MLQRLSHKPDTLLGDPQQAVPPAHATLRIVGAWVVFMLLGLLVSSQRIVIAAGVEVYFASFFYFLCYRWAGFRSGMVAAVLFSIPTIFWWGHIFSVALAVANIVFLHFVMPRMAAITLKTVLFYLFIGSLAAAVFLKLHYQAPNIVIGVSLLRKALMDITFAALADVIALFIALDARSRPRLRRQISLEELLSVTLLSLALISGTSLFVSRVSTLPVLVGFAEERARSHIENALLRTGIPADEDIVDLQSPFGREGSTLVTISTDPALLRSENNLTYLGCKFVDDHGASQGANDRNTFAYWLDACMTGEVNFNGQPVYYTFPTENLYKYLYSDLFRKFWTPFLIMFVVIVTVFLLQWTFRRSLDVWTRAVSNFAAPDLSMPEGFIFSEFRRPIEQFVRENNDHVRVIEDRRRLVSAVRDLQKSIDLKLLEDVRFDHRDCTLSFQHVGLEGRERHRSIAVHPNDASSVEAVEHEDSTMVEFRAADNPGKWYLLVVRDRLGDCWEHGCLFELRQHRMGRQTQMQHARLIELGGMASAISHELKQPLFTISLSAENADFILDSEGSAPDAKVREKLGRITEQVNRARTIIDRISRYARIDDAREENVELVETINLAASFIRPLFVQSDIRLSIESEREEYRIRANPVGLQQVLVNALQNAIDAIETRREEKGSHFLGCIDIRVTSTAEHLLISLSDNGTGLQLPEGAHAFDAFLTTKESGKGTGLGLYISHQIMIEMGGRIEISDRTDGTRGTLVKLELPRSLLIGAVRTDAATLVDADAVS